MPFKFMLCILLLASGSAVQALSGDAPVLPETSLDPVRNVSGASRVAPTPSAMVKVVIPQQGGQARLQTLEPQAAVDAQPTVLSPIPTVAPQASWTSGQGDGVPAMTPSASAAGGDASDSGLMREVSAPAPEVHTLAVIDGVAITDQDVTRELWIRKGRETLDWMVGKAILERELSRLELSVSEDEVDVCLAGHMQRFAEIFPAVSGREALARAASGTGLDEYRQRTVWVELALRKIMQKTLKPSDDQLRIYFAERQAAFVEPEKVRIRQIFIAPPPGPDGDITNSAAEWGVAERLIVEAHTRLRMGEDFLSVASSYASGSTSPRWAERGELLRELEEAAFSLRPGAVSAPIRTGMGFHIISVEERRERKLPRFEEVREKVLAEFENRYFLAAAGDFMTRLKDQALKDGVLVMGAVE